MKITYFLILTFVAIFMNSCEDYGNNCAVYDFPLCSESSGTILTKAEFFAQLPSEKILSFSDENCKHQLVHPDVLFFENRDFGKQFFMAVTPYPKSQDFYENPVFLASDNGVDFCELEEGMNPLARAPFGGYNNDTDLSFDEESREFRIFYQETDISDSQKVVLLRSKNGFDWQRQEVFHLDLSSPNEDLFSLSPTLVKKDSLNYLFVVNGRGENSIQFLTSENGLSWDKNNRTTIQINKPENFDFWHIDIFQNDSTYYLLTNGFFGRENFTNQNLYIGRSTDLLNWELIEEPILKNSKDFYSSGYIYRSSGIVSGDSLAVWFSYRTEEKFGVFGKAWRVGLKKFSLSEIFPN
ncbi:MAG: hypothetical protein DWQ06_16315 [Calditrichaeota bacterium]|nr:MAG: hypothetical protein DWQ06_16315 [Calditrichota bacterium]